MDNEMIDFINKHWDGSTDNSGQIIIYTGMMEDDDGNIVEWRDRFEENENDKNERADFDPETGIEYGELT